MENSEAIRANVDPFVLLSPRQRWRVRLNRVLFRGMLFTMGSIAVVLYRLLPNKNITWSFAKLQARNLIRLCGVNLRVQGLEQLGAGPYMFTPNHQSNFDIAALLGVTSLGIIDLRRKRSSSRSRSSVPSYVRWG